jgi:hypothetical protein
MRRLTGLAPACFVAVLARVVYVLALAGTRLSDDEISFWAVARNLADGKGFSYLGQATAWRPPLYPGLLALAHLAGGSIRQIQLGQALLGAATPVLFYGLAHALTRRPPVALLAAWIGALYPPYIYFAGRLLSENVSIPLYVLALWATIWWLEHPGYTPAVLCGLAWGAAVIARPTALPVAGVAAVLGIVALAADRTRPGATDRTGPGAVARLLPAVAMVVAVLVVLVPWVVRNDGSVGGPEPVTSNEGFALWAANRPDTHQLKNVLDNSRYPGIENYAVFGRAFPGIERVARADRFDFDTASEAARDRWFRSLALHDIESKPLRFAGLTVERAGYLMIPAPDNVTQVSRTDTADKLVLWVTSGPVLALGLIGLVLLMAREPRRGATWLLMLAAIGALGLAATHVPEVRYRVDGVDPVLTVSAAVTVAAVLSRWCPAFGSGGG